MFRLDRKIAPVTGAGSGIGRAIANPFANARACLCWSAIPGWEGTRGRIRAKGEMSTAIDCDVAAAESVGAAFRQIDREAPRIDILVNNAGITHIGTIENTSEKDLDSIHAVNVKGLFLCSRAAVPRMRKGGGGAIPNLTSIASLIGLVDRSAYSIGKRVVLAMTRSIAADFIGDKIRCNGVCPARVHTPFVDGPQGRLPGA
jgi:NAD(P)-dependent dehydrogenase (short-subunit alcohol dehydrogenase family)